MKIYVLSDLHLEFEGFEPPDKDVDVVVLAGDIHVESEGLLWAIDKFQDIPVIYVLGNHEYYETHKREHLASIKKIASGSNVQILENETTTIMGVQFLCCTLWTDFSLHGNPRAAKSVATRYISDYEAIKYGTSNRKIKTSDVARFHCQSVRWLSDEIEKRNHIKRIVVTHHAPSRQSLPDKLKDDKIGAAYASDLEDLVMESKAGLWIHGHIHNQNDYTIGQTRVISNPRGYSDEPNPEFIPDLVLEV